MIASESTQLKWVFLEILQREIFENFLEGLRTTVFPDAVWVVNFLI